MHFQILPIPPHLQPHVEAIRILKHDSDQPLAINVLLNGLPGIVFQHHDGQSPIDNITTRSAVLRGAPTLYVYGQMTQPGVMNHKPTPFTSIQVVLKPHALQSLLGLNASVLTNSVVDLAEFSAGMLNEQLMESKHTSDSVAQLLNFLSKQLQQSTEPDCLIQESLSLIHHRAATMTIRTLLEQLNISERQFEKRFSQAVGLSPHFYMRIRRFHEAVRLIKTGQFATLADVAHRLNFYDQSHFIRDIKAFSGVTPTSLAQKVEDLDPDQRVLAYS
jgi:AraC-like DNA-binding protein